MLIAGGCTCADAGASPQFPNVVKRPGRLEQVQGITRKRQGENGMTTNTPVSQPMIGDPAPLFDMLDPKGNQFSLADQRGKIIVIHFGTTW